MRYPYYYGQTYSTYTPGYDVSGNNLQYYSAGYPVQQGYVPSRGGSYYSPVATTAPAGGYYTAPQAYTSAPRTTYAAPAARTTYPAPAAQATWNEGVFSKSFSEKAVSLGSEYYREPLSVKVGETTSNSVGSNDRVDVAHFTSQEGVRLKATVRPKGDVRSDDLVVALYNADSERQDIDVGGPTVATVTGKSNKEYGKEIEFDSKGGDQFLVITDLKGNPVEYELKLEKVHVDVGGITQADAMAGRVVHAMPGGEFKGLLETPDDADLVEVNLVAGKAYMLDVQGAPSEIGMSNARLQAVRDANGNVVYDSSLGKTALSGRKGNPLLAKDDVFIAPNTGKYFLEVSNQSGSFGAIGLGTGAGGYSGRITELNLKPNFVESSGVDEGAKAIKLFTNIVSPVSNLIDLF
ncbi:MAG: hypothetical protein KF874_05935 [Rhizobiaceae bacterium]|nr:hypothetical protein [Rhizobiaceae bacterium]